MTLGELAHRARGLLKNIDPTVEFSGFTTDSRRVKVGDVYLAIKGTRVDGHAYIDEAISNGATAAWVTDSTDAPCLQVDDLVDSIASFGSSIRQEFTGPVIGVTGSHGKTTTKEFIASALSPLGDVLKSQGNKNTEYTSPLVWLGCKETTRSAVLEMGMRGLGQIAHLAKVHKPTIGVVTVVGSAHVEKVGTRAGIVKAKSELLLSLPKDGTAILWADDDYLNDLKQSSPCQVKTFGFSRDADCHIVGYRVVDWQGCVIRGVLNGESFEINLPAVGRHQALNAGATILAASEAGVSISQAAKSIESAQIPELRMQVVDWHGVTVLLDTYNASPDSTIAALKTLMDGPGEGNKIAILGEMKELGDYAESGHREVGKVLGHLPIDEVFFTGGLTSIMEEEAVAGGLIRSRIKSTLEVDIAAIRNFLDSVKPGDVVLIKGSRALGLERALEQEVN